MALDLLNPRDCLQFPAPFRSLMTACEANGVVEELGADAFEIRFEHMLPWLERNGLETAKGVGAHLEKLVADLRRKGSGTVWSREFDFNHRWSSNEAAGYFERWHHELGEASRLFEAKSIVLLSLIQRIDSSHRAQAIDLGESFRIPLSEREFAVLSKGDAIRDEDAWYFVLTMVRDDTGAKAALCRPHIRCEFCQAELEITRDEDDPNDQWRIECCEQLGVGKSIAEVTMNWSGWQERGRFFRPFYHD